MYSEMSKWRREIIQTVYSFLQSETKNKNLDNDNFRNYFVRYTCRR